MIAHRADPVTLWNAAGVPVRLIWEGRRYRVSDRPTPIRQSVDVPAMTFLMLDGRGDPNTSPDYASAIAALYSVAFTLKFGFKRGPQRIDFAVMPLEGLWWADDPKSFLLRDKSQWQWTMMSISSPSASRAKA